MSFSGLLNTSFILQTRTLSTGSTGQQIESWSGTTSYPCRLSLAGQGERRTPQRIVTRTTHRMVCQHGISGLDETARVVIGGLNYAVLLVVNAAGHGHHTTVYLEQAKDGSN